MAFDRLARTRSAIAAAVVLAACLGCTRPSRQPREVPPGTPSLTVMSFNVNYGLAGDPATVAAIRAAGVDAVFLQETTPRWESALRRELTSEFPHMEFRHSPGAGGLAVLSKHPFEGADYIASPSGWFPALRIVLDAPFGPLQVLQVHLQPPISDSGSVVSGYVTTRSVRVKEIEVFARALRPGIPALVVGDFNEGHDGQAVAALHRLGMQSTLREYDPYRKTWRWQTSVGTLTRTLDHIFYGPGLAPVEARVVAAGRSDHLPVLATFILCGPKEQESAAPGSC